MITIAAGSAEPPFEQVKRQITEAVESGELAPGDKLPTVRRLAGDLGIAPNTVARAYRELEQAAVVSTRGRQGTFVSGDEVQRAARGHAATYADQIRALGLSTSEALDLVRRALERPTA